MELFCIQSLQWITFKLYGTDIKLQGAKKNNSIPYCTTKKETLELREDKEYHFYVLRFSFQENKNLIQMMRTFCIEVHKKKTEIILN